jgi:hypothetical protein
MTYKINKTDGSLLTEVIDSAIDTTATDIALIGKNVTGYGEFLNENFIKILENFASTTEPNNPITGQLWFDTSENRLKVYDGNGFRIGSGPIVSGSAPLNPIQGDFWIDSDENQLYFYDGTDRQLAGPIYKNSQGISGFTVETISDIDGNQKTIVKLWVAQTLIGIFSKYTEFTPAALIPGFSGTIKPGFTAGTLDGLQFNVTASTANALIDSLGNVKPSSSFMLTDEDNTATGTQTILNAIPLTLGPGGETSVNVSAGTFQIRSDQNGQDIKLTTRQSSLHYDAVTIKSASNRVGIFNNAPDVMLHIGTVLSPGSVIIEGDLTVNGTSTIINSTTLEVDDKLIELSKTASPSDTIADGGGIVLKGDTDHSLTWNNSTDAWNSSEHFNIPFLKEYRINGTKILDSTSLGTSVVSSSLTSVGTLTELQVDNININGGTISSSAGNITLSPAGAGVVSVASSKITNALSPDPGDPSHYVATKGYVDSLISYPWQEIFAAEYVAVANDRLLVDTSSGPVRVVLPDDPVEGDTIRFLDFSSTFDSDNLTVARYRTPNLATLGGTSGAIGTYTGCATSAVIGSGVGLVVNVTTTVTGTTYTSTNTSITVTQHGTGYKNGDTIKILGTALGGTTPVNDLVVDLSLINILSFDDDLIINDADAGFGLIYLNYTQGWKYTEVASLPASISADIVGNVTGNVTGNVLGNVTGNVLGNVTGNLTGSVLTASQSNITSVGTLTFLDVSGGITGDLTGSLFSTYDSSLILDTTTATSLFTGNVLGNISNDSLTVTGTSTLTLESQSNAIYVVSGNSGLRVSAYDNTGTQEQYAVQVTPGAASGLRSTTLLFGDVVVSNTSTSNINGSSFRLPSYTAAELAARTLTFLNYGELIYNSDTNNVQAYISPGTWVNIA